MDASTQPGPDADDFGEAIEADFEPLRAGHPRISGTELIAVAAGGAFGALGRVAVAQAWPTGAGSWPWATFTVNVLGAFLLGAVLAGLRSHSAVSIPIYRLLGTGFCGAFTTFSTVQVELLEMLDRSRFGLAAGYLCVSVAAGYAAVATGARLMDRTVVEAQPAGEQA